MFKYTIKGEKNTKLLKKCILLCRQQKHKSINFHYKSTSKLEDNSFVTSRRKEPVRKYVSQEQQPIRNEQTTNIVQRRKCK